MDNRRTFTNLIWRFAERCGAQGVNFLVSIILARLLLPEYYGTIALVSVFISILNVFVDCGFANALIQKKDADDLDFSSVLIFNIIWCIVLYGVLFLISPYISVFYKQPDLTLIIRILGFTLVISGVKNVQQAYVSRTLQFKKFFFSTLGGTISSAVVGIIMAYLGFGVWALVVQQVMNVALDTIILWITVKWRPQLIFSFKRLKGLITYGWKLLASGLLDTVYNNLYQLIIGKIYSTSDLAYYNKGNSFPNLIITNLNSSIDSVLFPVMSMAQDDKTRVKYLTRQSIKVSSYIVWPIVVGLGVCAEPVVRILLTDKWLECVPYLQIFCFTYGFWPIHTANLNAIKAMGKSDVFLKLEVIKKIIGITAIIIAVKHGVMAIAVSVMLVSPINAFVNAFPNKKLLNYRYREQLEDMLPSMLIAFFMGGIVYCITFLGLNAYFTLILQFTIGVIIYTTISYVLKLDSFKYLIQLLKSFKRKV